MVAESGSDRWSKLCRLCSRHLRDCPAAPGRARARLEVRIRQNTDNVCTMRDVGLVALVITLATVFTITQISEWRTQDRNAILTVEPYTH